MSTFSDTTMARAPMTDTAASKSSKSTTRPLVDNYRPVGIAAVAAAAAFVRRNLPTAASVAPAPVPAGRPDGMPRPSTRRHTSA